MLRDLHECSALAEIKELRLAPRPVAMAPHNSQARKNAPNKSNDGAPLAEQPPRQTDARHRRALREYVPLMLDVGLSEAAV